MFALSEAVSHRVEGLKLDQRANAAMHELDDSHANKIVDLASRPKVTNVSAYCYKAAKNALKEIAQEGQNEDEGQEGNDEVE